MGRIHAATRLTPRLARVLRELANGRPRTTRELIERAGVCAVNTCVSELRALGYVIECKSQGHDGHGAHVYAYRSLGVTPRITRKGRRNDVDE